MSNKDDSVILKAIEAESRRHHGKAASLYRQAGNQIRNPNEKKLLWDKARKSEIIRDSD